MLTIEVLPAGSPVRAEPAVHVLWRAAEPLLFSAARLLLPLIRAAQQRDFGMRHPFPPAQLPAFQVAPLRAQQAASLWFQQAAPLSI